MPATHPQFFDGRNHTISNIKLKDGSLFEAVGTLTSIKNMKLTNVVMTPSQLLYTSVGGLIGRNLGVVDNVSVDFHYEDAFVQASSIGGIVGINTGSINRSSSSGSISILNGQTSYVGGLVGSSFGGTIDNSYSTLAITEKGTSQFNNCGGLVGKMTDSSINHSYTYSSVFCARENSVSGGLVGEADASNSPGISNSFAKGYVGYQAGSYHGAIVGKGHGASNYPNTFFDSQSTTQPYCTNAQPAACTAKNLFWQDIYYFNNSTTNAPYNTWDFTSIWKTTSYFPTLNDITLSPDRPSNLIGITSLTTADLSWEAPLQDGGSPITDYIVQYKKSSDNFWTIFNDGVSTSTSTTVTGLDQGALYNYRVRAVNAAGNGIYSFARTELQLQPKIQSPVAIEFEHGETINYSISLVNTTSQPIDSINTTFLSNSFDIESITPAIGVEGGAPTDIGEVTNGQIWNGLLEPDQELVFEVHGTVSALPNEVGKLSFAGASISYQGTPLDLGEDSDGTIHAESTSFIVKETATNFDIKTSLRETGMIDDGDTVHLKYSIKNNGPKAGFFTDSSVYIFIPPSISVSEIENDYLVCSNIVLIGDNLTSGIYADLQGHVFTQCVGTGGKIANVYETITINITGTATRDLNAGDVYRCSRC